MKYLRGILSLSPTPSIHGPIIIVTTGDQSIGVYDDHHIENKTYEPDIGINLMNMAHNAGDVKDHKGQVVLFTIEDHTPTNYLDRNSKEAGNLWAVPALLDGEQLKKLPKVWDGLGSAIKVLNLVVVTEENRSKYGDAQSTFTLARFNLLVDTETTTEEDILRVLGWHFKQDPKEFHIGEKSLGHPDNPVPAGMQGYTYKSNAGLLIVGADKFTFFPKKMILKGDGSPIPADAKTTLSGETILGQGLNPMNPAMKGHDTYPILEKKTPLGKQKVTIDENGCLITRIAPYQSNVPRGAWFY